MKASFIGLLTTVTFTLSLLGCQNSTPTEPVHSEQEVFSQEKLVDAALKFNGSSLPDLLRGIGIEVQRLGITDPDAVANLDRTLTISCVAKGLCTIRKK